MIRSALALLCAFTFFAPLADAQARLVVDPPKLHLGSVYYGSSIEGSVQLVNVGDAPLIIEDVKSSCGCTAASLGARDKTIAPGARVTLPITMTPKSGSTPLRKRVNIISNDPATKITSIEVSCDVQQGVAAEPSFILFADADIGDTPSRRMTLTSHNGIPFQIKTVTFTNPIYRATWDRSAALDLRHTIDIEAGPIDARLVKSALMNITTTHPQTPQLRLNINTRVIPAVDYEPKRLTFAPTKPGEVSTVRMKIWNRDTRGPVRVLATSMPNERAYDFDAVQDTTDPLMWTFSVGVPEGESRRHVSGAISLMTDQQTVTLVGVVPIAP